MIDSDSDSLFVATTPGDSDSASLCSVYDTSVSLVSRTPCATQILQFDMWGVTPSSLWDWPALKARIAQHGVRNSLLLAPMPTASTAQILGNNESFEPYTSNVFARRVLSGEFQVRQESCSPCALSRGCFATSLLVSLADHEQVSVG